MFIKLCYCHVVFLGNNPVTVCNNCKGGQEEYCTSNDPYAGYHGAFHCMATGDGEVAFVRHHTVTQYVSRQNESSTADVSILCAISAICTRVLPQ